MRTEAATMTLAEYAAWDESEGAYLSELVRGVVVREPRPGRTHGRVQARIALALGVWARSVDAEIITESGFILSEDPPTLRGPDVAVVLRPRSGEGEPGDWVRGSPDLAVEVLSPSDASTAIQQKTLDYLRAGASLVWIVDPTARTVTVYRADGSARIVRDHETLEGESVLVGFSVALTEWFERA
jgi:Uma2 family endonuclease